MELSIFLPTASSISDPWLLTSLMTLPLLAGSLSVVCDFSGIPFHPDFEFLKFSW